MSITEDKLNKSSGLLKVSINISDYQDKVEASIKGYRKKVTLPGFRAGMVPVSLIKKKYGLSIKIEEINKLLSEKVNSFLKDNNPSIMGYPLPKKKDIDWDKDVDYTFEYELGYKPDFKITFPKKDEVTLYSINPEKKQIDDAIENLRKQHGENTFPSDIKDNDILYIHLNELQKKGDEKKLISHSTSLLVDNFKDKLYSYIELLDNLLVDSLKKKLIQLKKDDELEIDIKKVFKNETELSSLLNIKKEELALINNNFLCKIESIKRVSPAKLSTEFFKKCFPDDTIKTSKEFREMIVVKFKEMYEKQSENKYFNDVIDSIISNTKIDLPDDFLKKWIVVNSDGKKNIEDVNKEYNLYQKSFCWELIKDKIVDEQKIDLSEESVFNKAKDMFRIQLLQYGMNKEGDELEKMTENLLQNKDEKRKIIEQIISEAMILFFKNKIKVKIKEISLDDFSKLVS